MAYYIPFLNSADDWRIARELYPDSPVYRVAMKAREEIGWTSSSQTGLWIDSEVDALHNWPKYDNMEFNKYFSKFSDARRISQSEFLLKPDKAIVSSFVSAILDDVLRYVPGVGWLSVPQLPHRDGTECNKINR